MAGLLQNKVALITGGARGQGASEVRLFAREGARVFVADLLDDAGEALVDEVRQAGGQADYLHLDVSNADDWARAVSLPALRDAGLDILINNAGINIRHQVTDTKREDWDRLLDVNLTGPLLGIQACVPLIKQRGARGSIVNVGSLAGLMGHPTTGYSAAKWGLRGLTKSAALELAPFNIRVNAMHPGLVETPIIDPESHTYQTMMSMTPLGRAGHADELANVVLFLASDLSSFVTGIDIAVDGGFSELAAYSEVWNRGALVTQGS